MKNLKWLSLLTLPIVIAGCKVGPNFKNPSLPLPQKINAPYPSQTASAPSPQGHAQTLDYKKEIPLQWWRIFHSQSINDLVTASFNHNPSVESAKQVLVSSLENLYASEGALLPFLGMSFVPSYQKTANILTSVLASNQYQYGLYTGQLFVSYTPDIFGGVRRGIEAYRANVEFERYQYEATYITLASNVVAGAIGEALLREEIKITKDLIKTQRSILTISQKQLQQGDIAVATYVQQEAILASYEAMLPPLELQLGVQRDLLNALAGRYPGDTRTPSFDLARIDLPKDLPNSLSSTLLEHRPDIKAAQAQMKMANAWVGVAIANRLPNFTIGFTNLGTAATSLSTLFQGDTSFWGLAGIISQPLFDAGALAHKQKAAVANYQQTVAQYKKTVIHAFQDLADTLHAIYQDAKLLEAASHAYIAADKSFNIAKSQYQQGDINSINLIMSEQLYLQAKLNLAQARASRLLDTVALYQALGGGWWHKYEKAAV